MFSNIQRQISKTNLQMIIGFQSNTIFISNWQIKKNLQQKIIKKELI